MTPFDRIKILAKKYNLTLNQLNDLAGLGSRSIYHWKTRNPTEENLAKVAKVLHTSTSYLRTGKDDESITAADLASPVLAYDGRPLTGQTAEEIRNFAAYLLQKEKAEEEKNNDAEKST